MTTNPSCLPGTWPSQWSPPQTHCHWCRWGLTVPSCWQSSWVGMVLGQLWKLTREYSPSPHHGTASKLSPENTKLILAFKHLSTHTFKCSLGLALKNVQNYFSGLKTLKCYAKTHFWIKRTTATASANVNNIPWHTDCQSLQHPYPPHWGPATAWHTHPCPATALNTPSPQPGTFNNLRSCSFCRWGDPTSHFSNRWKVTAPQE